jgi:YD repeat-containing protein
LVQFAEYDANGNCLGVARAFTVSAAELASAGTDVYAYEPADLFWEQRASYDADGRQISSTDAYVKTTYYEYDSHGNLVKTTDPFGNETVNEYDDYNFNRLLRSIDASGVVTRYEYEEMFGNIHRIVQELPDGGEIVLTTMTSRVGWPGRLTPVVASPITSTMLPADRPLCAK